MSRLAFLLLFASACEVGGLRDLPPEPAAPGPGTIYGVVVTARAGRATREPAPGAEISLVGTALRTTAGPDGRFLLEGLVDASGTILLRFSPPATGGSVRQKLLKLEDVGAGPNRQISLGEIAVTENARIAGRVRRADRADRTGGHGGIRVFIPEAPFFTQTADDGTFVLDGLAEGPAILAFFDEGYVPASVDGIALRGGEELLLGDRLLQKGAGDAAPGAIRGVVQLVPPATDGELVVVTAVGADGHARSTTAAAREDGTAAFEVGGLEAGVYSVIVGRQGYATAESPNVPVLSGETSYLTATVVLVRAASGEECREGVACVPADPCREGRTACVSGVAVCEQQEARLAPGASCGDDRVCSVDGACRACRPGAACTPENPCHEGILACGTGEATCEDTGAAVPSGTACGDGSVCSPEGECLACDGGVVCDAGECRLGAVSCASGVPECRSLALFAPAGHACGEDLVCGADGECRECRAGSACTPTNRCRAGRLACDTGEGRCLETDEAVPAGTTCAPDRVCDGLGACVPCVAGASCTPENPCHDGKLDCSTGAPTCVDTAAPGVAGTPCAAGKVCTTAGACEACAIGTLCQASACRLGTVSCESGAAECRENGLLALSGEACGEGHVCDPAGTCRACSPGGACTPSNVCRRGAVSCSTGVERCVETGEASAAGTACAAGRVCDGFGACVACGEGADCVPGDAPCELGKVSCTSGAPVCVGTGTSRPAGFGCGDDRVCSPAGTCEHCPVGEACQPSSAPCKAGRIACTTGAPVCQPTASFAPAGTGCGASQVCDTTGECVACAANAACTPADPCRQGAASCATGAAVCVDAGAAQPAGFACGADKVCNAAGLCLACQQGAGCTPSNACLTGTLDCTSGTPTCHATGSGVANGTACGTNLVCKAGACQACVADAPCKPANPCRVGRTVCATGDSVCAEQAANAPDGTTCGTNLVCKAGACLPSGLTVVAGDAQTGFAGQLLSVVGFELRDGSGAVVVNRSVTFTPSSGGVVTPATVLTDSTGRASASWRLGMKKGAQTLDGISTDGATARATATATAPPAGTIHTFVNVSRTNSTTPADSASGPALAAKLSRPWGLATASNGAIYVSDPNGFYVRRVEPDGSITAIAGGGNVTTDGGPAVLARLFGAHSLALDEPRQRLYVAEYSGISGAGRIRSVDLATGVIGTLAGGGSASAPDYGDGGTGAGASFAVLGGLLLTPDGRTLLAVDVNRTRVRTIDLDTTLVGTLFASTQSGCACTDVQVNSLYQRSNLVWRRDPAAQSGRRAHRARGLRGERHRERDGRHALDADVVRGHADARDRPGRQPVLLRVHRAPHAEARRGDRAGALLRR